MEVKEMMTGRGNIKVVAVAATHDDLTRIAKTLDELGVEVESEELLRRHYFRPFNHFGTEDISGELEGTYEV